MEYLTRILNVVTGRNGFKFHPLCKALKLCHMCFADDLLRFSRGDEPSLLVLLRDFATFSEASGLEINKDKSDMYLNGVRQESASNLLAMAGFQEGAFPFRYLGIPISYMRIAVGDCSRLVEKMVGRIWSLGAGKLSYAGRLILVQSVLAQLQTYWARIFIIPSTVITKLMNICRNYLWACSDEFLKVPPVSWDKVCSEKKKGGLGVINSKLWNQAMIGKYCWWIVSKADHLWIKWVNHIYINGQDWFSYQPSLNSSWTWRQICKIKDLMKSGFVQDQWSMNGGRYNTVSGYEWLMGTQIQVPWVPVVWNRLHVPKHSFIAWVYSKACVDRVNDWLRLRIPVCEPVQ
ncbi:uncharacterized protein LOC141632591 [Silene latifolia]|uniref:uncharacterized protein LOC141632591 n=1 Tax=Silene latifolia TaxID=37657 RepID=UPI003D7808AB